MDTFVTCLAIALPMVVGAVVISFELRARRKLQAEELNFRKEQFEIEKSDRKEREDWLRRETSSLKKTAEKLAKYITQEMRDDLSWATETLKKAKLGLHSKSIFGERTSHFYEEKEFIADQFVPILMNRCRALAEERDKVYLLIDSGTTLYPFFEKLGKAAIRCHANNEEWIKKLVIATNNLPGVERLTETALLEPNNRFSKLAIKCRLFPGEPLPIYAAITGPETIEAVDNIGKENREKCAFISLIVGNWIRIKHENNCVPVAIPLARGEGHLEFKEKIIDVSDEIYLITPFGKIFFNTSLKDINYCLGFSQTHADPDRQPYSEINIDESKISSISLISTSRSNDRVLNGLSDRIQGLFNTDKTDLDRYKALPLGKTPPIQFLFGILPEDRFLELDVEFPHSHTRNDEFREKMFFVPRQFTHRD